MNPSKHQDKNILLIEPISYKIEVEFAINSLNVRKACGVDNIRNEVLKNQNTNITYSMYVFKIQMVPNV